MTGGVVAGEAPVNRRRAGRGGGIPDDGSRFRDHRRRLGTLCKIEGIHTAVQTSLVSNKTRCALTTRHDGFPARLRLIKVLS